MTEVFTQPAFAAAELERARRLALDGLRVAYAEPGSVARIAATRALFGGGAYGHPDEGTPASVARIGQADVRRMHALLYRPDQAVLVLAGDITPELGLRLAGRYLGAWRAPAAPLPPWPPLQGTPLAAPVVAVDMPGAGQASVVVTLPGVARDAPDFAAGQVSNALLGGGYSSRLNQEIRIRRGLSYDAGSSLVARRGGGQIELAAQTDNAAAAQVLALMRAELERVAEAAPPDAELQARKATLIGAISRSVETTDGLAQRLAQLAVGGVPLAQIGRAVAEVEQVTPDQVQAFARAHWRSPALRVAVAGDAKEFGAALLKAEPSLVTIPIGAFDAGRIGLRQ
jgi:zinc protease